MHLANDYIHPTPRGGRCRIRIYIPEEEIDAPVVICSELCSNEGASVTYAAEQLAAERGADTQMHNRALSFAASDASGPADHAAPEAGGDGEGEQRQ